MGDDEARELVNRWWRMWGTDDFDMVPEICAEPYLRHTGIGSERLSHDQHKQRLRRTREVMRGSVTTIEDQVVSADKVWTRATSRGVNLSSAQNTVLSWIVIHRIADGKIAETWAATVHGVEWKDLSAG